MSEVLIHKDEEKALVHLELNLPSKRNVLSLEMIQALTKHFENLKNDTNLQLLILSGQGGHFCAGGDLRWMGLSEEASDIENLNQVKLLSQMFLALEQIHVPVIGDIKGSVFGGGLGLVALCDIVIAHRDCRFCFSELKLALVPSLIAPFVLKNIPFGKLRELIFSARIFSSEEAYQMGLIHFFGSTEECEIYKKNFIGKLLSYDKIALKETKKLLNFLSERSSEDSEEYRVQLLAERRKSLVVAQNIRRFLKSRTLKKSKRT